jgi:hypothetical protein
MSFRLPLAGSAAREMMGDVVTVAETLNPANAAKLLTTLQARNAAARMFEADTTKAMKRVCFIVIRADSDERWLISFGRRGGWRKEWNFGTGRD